MSINKCSAEIHILDIASMLVYFFKKGEQRSLCACSLNSCAIVEG